MAGGKGARLGALTLHVPKPMLRVAGRPILERIVLHLVGNGVRRVFLAVNYLAEVIESHFRDGEGFGCRIEYLREEQPLGTGGALALLPEPPQRALLVMNGDLITQTQVGRMLDFHEEGGQAVTMAVRRHVQQVPYGCVEVSGDALVGFAEKPTSEHLINTGIYVLAPQALRMLRCGEAISVPALIERVRGADGAVRVFETDDEWIDVGQVDELSRARGLR
jgi:NDP-sugar pyrophosphorylase family protein